MTVIDESDLIEQLKKEVAHLKSRLEEIQIVLDKLKEAQTSGRNRAGYIYLLETVNANWKIGRTKHPENRLKTFGSKLPFQVKYRHLMLVEDMYRTEAELHEMFASKRLNGSEFFELNEDDVFYICSLAPNVDVDDILKNRPKRLSFSNLGTSSQMSDAIVEWLLDNKKWIKNRSGTKLAQAFIEANPEWYKCSGQYISRIRRSLESAGKL